MKGLKNMKNVAAALRIFLIPISFVGGCFLVFACGEKPVDLDAVEKEMNAAIMESPTISNEQFEKGDLPIGEKEAIALALADARKATKAALPKEAAFELEIRGVQLVTPYYALREEKMEGKFIWAVEFSVSTKAGAEQLGYCRSIILMSGFKYSHFYTPAEQKELAESYGHDTSLPFIAGRYENGYWSLRSKKKYAKATEITAQFDSRAVATGKFPMSFATAVSLARAHGVTVIDRTEEVWGEPKGGVIIKNVATVGYLPEKELWFVEFYFETADGVDGGLGFDFFLPIEILANGECFPFLEDFVKYTGDPDVPRPVIEE